MKKEKCCDMPFTVQRRFPSTEALGESNAIPRSTEHDLEPVTSKTRIGSWGDEQTFRVPKKGNIP